MKRRTKDRKRSVSPRAQLSQKKRNRPQSRFFFASMPRHISIATMLIRPSFRGTLWSSFMRPFLRYPLKIIRAPLHQDTAALDWSLRNFSKSRNSFWILDLIGTHSIHLKHRFIGREVSPSQTRQAPRIFVVPRRRESGIAIFYWSAPKVVFFHARRSSSAYSEAHPGGELGFVLRSRAQNHSPKIKSEKKLTCFTMYDCM